MSSKHNPVFTKHNTILPKHNTNIENTTQYLRNTTQSFPDDVMQDVTIQVINPSLLNR